MLENYSSDYITNDIIDKLVKLFGNKAIVPLPIL